MFVASSLDHTTHRLPAHRSPLCRIRIDGRIVSTTTSANAAAAADTAAAASASAGGISDGLLSDLTLEITMAMGNCPKYLHIRDLVKQEQATSSPPIQVR